MLASPLTACITSNGDAVRDNGIRPPAGRRPTPAGARARYFWPSTVLIRMVAPVSGPSRTASSMRKSTRTYVVVPSRASDTSVTLPTLTPATRTSLPAARPLASRKAAV